MLKEFEIGNELEYPKEFFVFYEIALRLLDLNNYQDSISKSLRILKDSFKFKKCEIYISEDDDLKVFASSDQDIEPSVKEFKEARILAQKSQERIIINNQYNDVVFFDKSKSVNLDSIIYLAIPLIHKGEVIGVFTVSFYPLDDQNGHKILFLEYITTLYRYALYSNFEKDYKVGKFQELKQYYEKEFCSDYYDIINSVFISESMQNLKNSIIKIAANDIRVLIIGEIGTEKLSIATMIHKLSHRQNKSFVILKPDILDSKDLEVELFGNKKHVQKGYKELKIGKFELASGGSLIIEDIEKLPLNIQKKLVDILKQNEYKTNSKYNVRLIATTSCNLENMVKDGYFNGDLYNLLNIVTIQVPPLRMRDADIEYFITSMLTKYNYMYSKKLDLTNDAMEYLKTYNYKANLKELECLMDKLVYVSKKDFITKKDILFSGGLISDENQQKEYSDILLTGKTLEDLEKEAIAVTLERTNYNQTEAAKRLGITLRQIGYKIKKYNLL